MFNFKKIRKNKRILLFAQLLLIGIIVLNIGSVIYQQRVKYTSTDYWQRYPKLKQIYYDSQYANKHPKGWVPDETVLSYAGGALIRGENPVLIIADSPPLSKYIIGLSALVFNNEHVVIIFFGFLSLLFLYLLSMQIFSNRLLSLLPPFFLSFEPIFKNQFVYTPLLDIMQLAFMLGGFWFFNKAIISKRHFLFFFLANLFLGMFISTKFFITGFIIVAAWYFVLLIHKDKKRLLSLTLSMPLSVFILLFSYIRILHFGYSLRDLLGIQKYVFLYHKSQLILPLSIWPLLLVNKWYIWWSDKKVVSAVEWNIFWPVITILSLLTVVLYIFKKIERKKEIETGMVWAAFYLLFFSFGEISPRYVIILLPILYVISIYGVLNLAKRYYAKKSY